MTEAYPLQWPAGWPRTPDHERQSHLAGAEHSNSQRWNLVTHRLFHELRLLKARDVVVSSNQPVRRDGIPYAAKRIIRDPGVAVYFRIEDRRLVLAQDRYEPLLDNMRSIALAVEGMRKMQRHGGDHMMERAFTGFQALPAPKRWWEVLGVERGASMVAIHRAWKALAKREHPDFGGSGERMAEINAALSEARAENGELDRRLHGEGG